MRVCRCLEGRGVASFLPASSRPQERIPVFEFSAGADAVAAILPDVSPTRRSGSSVFPATTSLLPISRNPVLLRAAEEKPDAKREESAR